MAESDKIKKAWMHGFVNPQASPGFVLPIDTSELPVRGGKALLSDGFKLLGRLWKESQRLHGDQAIVALIDAGSFPAQVELVAVDLERGTEGQLPFPPPDAPHATPKGTPAGHRGAPVSDPPPGGARSFGAEFEEALWRAWHILKRFSEGELQTFQEVEEAINDGPMADLTRRYVATVRPSDPGIVTARGLLSRTGLRGVRDALPMRDVAAAKVRCWTFDERSGRGAVQILRLHEQSKRHAEMLDPAKVHPKPLMIEVNVPTATARALLEVAMPEGWSIRVALSIGRKLLEPDEPVFTVTHAELPPDLTTEVCKERLEKLIDAANAHAKQLRLWDDGASSEG